MPAALRSAAEGGGASSGMSCIYEPRYDGQIINLINAEIGRAHV